MSLLFAERPLVINTQLAMKIGLNEAIVLQQLHYWLRDTNSGSRMFWFDKSDERAIFSDIRKEGYTLRNGRRLIISPDIIADFRALSFADASFSMVVLDPPHLESVGDNAWMGKKYGRLNKDAWRDDSRQRFKEAFRVLRPHGVLIF